ncbi:MAG TPA: hypothetical protein VFG49_13425 [Dyella sp.]|uniref:hypothetical protein n=1 Tax=Dyella sp. TaxID=1869338 RepID=UPI002D7907DB|nr:hypothetical protein [Dyella sp.]HET6554521.1 hypothetical protein [Dyella sp.]
MTLPNRPRDVITSPDTGPVEATPPRPAPEPMSAADAHVDYDRHPFSVRWLDHYIDNSAGDGRFHISG